ncbi:hypothetical protein BDZ91DRAFT_550920 [Kalaharituber pfeilii]|nr:hypothetical protein BDZ91DRAFT_550920 [Kalaharituber pfeilii]
MPVSTKRILLSLLFLAVSSIALPLRADGEDFNMKGLRSNGEIKAFASKPFHRPGTCESRPKLYRKGWHTLTATERKAYIDAELCMMRLPARLASLNPNVRTHFDDMQAMHQHLSPQIHNSGWFLPYHRYLMWVHETLLREACEYTGAQPYWEESRDAGKFSVSSVFSPKSGFGGNGRPEDGCLADGPFAGYTLSVGPGYDNKEHCLNRFLNDTASLMSLKQNADACMQEPTFARAWPCIENLPHRGGHNSVGGEMSNPISSPGDPLFYLHHTYIDKLWWDWQRANLDSRLKEIAGMTTAKKPETGWVLATLNDTFTAWGLVRDVQIHEIMDIENELLCYAYVS